LLDGALHDRLEDLRVRRGPQPEREFGQRLDDAVVQFRCEPCADVIDGLELAKQHRSARLRELLGGRDVDDDGGDPLRVGGVTDRGPAVPARHTALERDGKRRADRDAVCAGTVEVGIDGPDRVVREVVGWGPAVHPVAHPGGKPAPVALVGELDPVVTHLVVPPAAQRPHSELVELGCGQSEVVDRRHAEALRASRTCRMSD
jgi:hypothetical protein